jgi:hypothetical protein
MASGGKSTGTDEQVLLVTDAETVAGDWPRPER